MCYEYLSGKEASKQQLENRRQVASFWRKVNAWIREITPAHARAETAVSRHPQHEKITG